MGKYNVQKRIEELTAKVEDSVASEMLEEFKHDMLKRFKHIKHQIEDWQNVNEVAREQLENRIKVISDKNNWNTNDILDMAVISSVLWNEKVNGK